MIRSPMTSPIETNNMVERLEGFAITMFRTFLVGLEHNKVRGWTRASSDEAERNFVAAMRDYSASLTQGGKNV